MSLLLLFALFGQAPPPAGQTPPPQPPKKAEKKKEEKPKKPEKKRELPVATIETTKGTIQLELEPTEAPIAVANFITLIRKGFYEGLTFHRVEPELIQGGDPKGDGTGGPGYTIPFEFNRGLKNTKGIVGMARQANDKDSAGSQFYILKKDVPGFDAAGYTLFGHVSSGQDVLDRIIVGDKITKVTIQLPTSFTPRPFGPSRRAEPDGLFTPDLPEDVGSRTYSRYVRVRAEIDAQGTARISVLKGSGDDDIDDAVVTALKRWKWQPALKTGLAVPEVQEFDYDLATNSRRYGGKK